MSKILVAPLTLLAALFTLPASTTYFPNTDHKVDVYIRQGAEPGKTVLVLGGIHGNESGAYKAADMLSGVEIRRGTLIVIPRVNLRAITANQRAVSGDMNRMFDPEDAPKGADAEVVSVVKRYIAKADLLLNLHDGSGYYDPVYRDALRNPARYGQSVIADCDAFYSEKYGSTVPVREQAEAVLKGINDLIQKNAERFHFSNHKTSDPRTRHPEQRKSATYYSMSRCGIPAFGIETSKNLRSDSERVKYQLMVIGEFLKLYGVEPVLADAGIAPPRIDFYRQEPPAPVAVEKRAAPAEEAPAGVAVEFSLNGASARIAIGKEIEAVRGDVLTISKDTHLRANVVGFVLDLRHNDGRDNGAAIDTARDLLPEHSLEGRGDRYRIRLYRDGADAGEVILRLVDPRLTSVTVSWEGEERTVSSGNTLVVPAHAHVRIARVETNLRDESGVKVNFLGFKGRGDGEDRGLDASLDDLLPEYALKDSPQTFPIRATRLGRTIGEVYLKIGKEE